MENYIGNKINSGIKAIFRKENFKATELNIRKIKFQNDKIKLTRHLLECTKEVGSNTKESSKTIKDRDLERHFSERENGSEISKRGNRTEMEFGMDLMRRQ